MQCVNELAMVEPDHCLSVISSKSSDNKVLPEDLEDGPLFRATIKELESRTSALKLHLKRIIKTATASLEAEQHSLVQDKTLIHALKEAPFSEPLFTHYLDDTWGKLHEQRERLVLCMQSLLIGPLQKLYDMDIKTADQKRRQFEETSKDYYAYLSKYLSIKSPKKKRSEDTEAKFLNKKRDFDLIRFDYYSFLMDLHGGKKQQEILYHLSSHYEKQYNHCQSTAKTLTPFKDGLDTLATIMQEASREQTVVHKERNEKRKMLESKYCPQSEFLYQHEEEPVALGISASSPIDNPYLKFKNIRDLEQSESQHSYGRRKEGFLFATSKPIKNSAFEMSPAVHWHKYWCVLSGGQLHEYSNWKRHLETHNEPIHLRCAAVREARNADRRFCFEIITPQFKRIYQATSNEELACWIATINNSISSLLNGINNSTVDLNKNEEPKATTKWKHNRSLSGALSGLTAAKDKYLKKRQRNQSANAGTSPIIIDSPTPDFSLLNKLRQHNESNKYCADCNARNPEWCSLNLGILICIECSGIHRSLGTHISKVRSLLLDSASFTFDIVELLFAIGNATCNDLYEYDCSEKPQPGDTREIKLKFIQAKYATKKFVKPSECDPDALLFHAIDTDDIPKALHAMALGADVNRPSTQHHPSISLLSDSQTLSLPMLDSHGNEYLDRTLEVAYISDIHRENYTVRYPLHFALLHGYPKPIESHSRNSSTSSSSSSSSYYSPAEDTSRMFAMAEFLFQNGADVYIKDEATGRLLADLVGLGHLVDDDAIEYLNMKNGLRGQSPITRTSAHLYTS